MKIRIEIISNATKASLIDGSKEYDSLVIDDQGRLSETLLLRIDELLERNGLSIQDISKVETKADQPDTFTSVRIIEAVAKGLNFKG